MSAIIDNSAAENLEALTIALAAGVITDAEVIAATKAMASLARAVEIGTAMARQASRTIN